MTRPSFTKGLCWLGLLIAMCCFAVAPVAAQNFQIKVLEPCVDVDETNNTVTAYFGYESLEKDVFELIIGSNNRFIPDPPDQGQPIRFYPGLHERAFRVTFGKESFALWNLQGSNMAATILSPRCTPQSTVANLIPFVERVTVSGTTATATFGYFNKSTDTITIPRGNVLNHLSVGQRDRGQPETFLPGLQRNVFSVTFEIATEPALTWMLQGLPALAVPNSTISCPIITIRTP